LFKLSLRYGLAMLPRLVLNFWAQWVKFCIWCEVAVQLYCFACCYPDISALFVAKTSFPIELSWHSCQKSIVRAGIGSMSSKLCGPEFKHPVGGAWRKRKRKPIACRGEGYRSVVVWISRTQGPGFDLSSSSQK
jgi:hypothetical protein